MGLDSSWIKPNRNTEDVTFVPPLGLRGSSMPNNPQVFRGQVYSPIVEAITGVSLHQQHIPNETLKEISNKLEMAVASGDFRRHLPCGYGYSESEVFDLCRMFAAYSHTGYSLTGWE